MSELWEKTMRFNAFGKTMEWDKTFGFCIEYVKWVVSLYMIISCILHFLKVVFAKTARQEWGIHPGKMGMHLHVRWLWKIEDQRTPKKKRYHDVLNRRDTSGVQGFGNSSRLLQWLARCLGNPAWWAPLASPTAPPSMVNSCTFYCCISSLRIHDITLSWLFGWLQMMYLCNVM